MSNIDINRDAVRDLGNKCATAGSHVKQGTSQLDGGYVPSTELACKSMWVTCQGAWSATFTRMSTTTTSVGGKLQTVANLVGTTDQALVDQFRPIAATEPDTVPGAHGGRHYR